MSVRDKIAGFGGAGSTSTTKLSNGFASTARIGTNVPMSSSNARSFPNDSASNGDAAVRKLKVPDAFQKNTQASGAPASSASSFPRDSAASKWGAKPGDKSGGSMGAIGGATGVTGVGSAAGTGTASQSSAPVQGSPSGECFFGRWGRGEWLPSDSLGNAQVFCVFFPRMLPRVVLRSDWIAPHIALMPTHATETEFAGGPAQASQYPRPIRSHPT